MTKTISLLFAVAVGCATSSATWKNPDPTASYERDGAQCEAQAVAGAGPITKTYDYTYAYTRIWQACMRGKGWVHGAG